MPHPLAASRDELNALIGPLEEIEAKREELAERLPLIDASANVLFYLNIASAIVDLQTLVSQIDEYVDEAEEPETVEEDESEDEDNDDN